MDEFVKEAKLIISTREKLGGPDSAHGLGVVCATNQFRTFCLFSASQLMLARVLSMD